jgi:hypothetical protein
MFSSWCFLYNIPGCIRDFPLSNRFRFHLGIFALNGCKTSVILYCFRYSMNPNIIKAGCLRRRPIILLAHDEHYLPACRNLTHTPLPATPSRAARQEPRQEAACSGSGPGAAGAQAVGRPGKECCFFNLRSLPFSTYLAFPHVTVV